MISEISEKSLRNIIDDDVELFLFEEVDSTNDFAAGLVKNKNIGTAVVIAKSQTSGRGTRGRSFYSPKGSGLYMSVKIDTDKFLNEIFPPTPAAAVSVIKSIKKSAGLLAGIKWVNDIQIEGKKVCGILAESKTDINTGMVTLIVGIGININTSFPEQLSDIASSLSDFTDTIDVNRLAGEIVNTLVRYVRNNRPDEYMDDYRKYCVTLGKQVKFRFNNETISGVAVDVTDGGHLVVDTKSGVFTVNSGDVTTVL